MTELPLPERLRRARAELLANEVAQAELESSVGAVDPMGGDTETDETPEERVASKKRQTLSMRGDELLREVKGLERRLKDAGVKNP